MRGSRRGSKTIEKEIAAGRFRFEDADEDIHLNIERRLIELAGEAGRRIHAGRSRNDQVALDLRLWTLGADRRARARDPRASRRALLDRAEAFLDATSRRRGAHAHAQPPSPSCSRTRSTRTSRCSCATSAAWPTPPPRRRLAARLGRLRRDDAAAGPRSAWRATWGSPPITANSLDAVSDRDFAVEFEAAAALAMTHLSRLAEDLILWTGDEYRLLALSEATTTGSSMMPQKKNPDALELARGKTGRVVGNLVATLLVVKGLPLSYNRDLQETQEAALRRRRDARGFARGDGRDVAGLTLRPAAERPPIEASIARDRHRRGARPPRRPLPHRARARGPLEPDGGGRRRTCARSLAARLRSSRRSAES